MRFHEPNDNKASRTPTVGAWRLALLARAGPDDSGPVCPWRRPTPPSTAPSRSQPWHEASTSVATSLATARTPTEAHGFLLRKGVFTLIDAPDAGAFIFATNGINNRGDVVGRYSDSEGVGHGFLLRHGHFTTIDVPGSLDTYPARYRRTRADRWLVPRKRRGLSRFHSGFARFPGHRVPGRRGHGSLGHQRSTRIVGGYGDTSGGVHGFLLKKGAFSSIDFPGAVGTRAFGINTRGHIVGGWSGDPECGDCFVNAFLLTPRGFTNLAFPNALETVA